MYQKKRTGVSIITYGIFAVTFTVVFILVMYPFLINNISFISIPSDGLTQHFVALKYYRKFLLEIFNNLMKYKQLIVPEYDISLGEGNDILDTLSYYVIGDPFCILSIFFSEKNMSRCYDFLVYFRLLISGFSFLTLCKYKKCKSQIFVLIGTIIYTINFYTITYGVLGHPFFLNSFVYLPFMFIGIEKIFDNKKFSLTYILSISISAISNFYFFYMHSVFIFLYVVLKLIIVKDKNWKKILTIISLSTIIALLISQITIFPMIYNILSDNRSKTLHMSSLFFNNILDNIKITTNLFFTNYFGGYYPFVGIPIVLLPIIFLSIKFDKNKFNKLIFLILIFLLYFKGFWVVINCFSYASPRWVFIIIFYISFIVAKNKLLIISVKTYSDWKLKKIFKYMLTIISLIGLIFITLEFVILSNYNNMLICNITLFIISLILFYLLIYCHKYYLKKIIIPLLLFLIMIFNVVYNIRFEFKNGKWTDEYLCHNEYNKNEKGVYNAINEMLIKNENNNLLITRVSGPNLDWDRNSNSLYGISSSQYYWTMTNPSVYRYRRRLGLIDRQPWTHTDYNKETIQNILSCVTYYTDNDIYKELPKFVSKDEIEIINNIAIYKNKYKLPFIYYYDSIVNEDCTEKLNTASLQKLMLEKMIINEKKNKKNDLDINLLNNDVSVQFDVKPDEGILIDKINKAVYVKDAGKKIEFEFSGKNDSELYLEINGLKCFNLDENSNKLDMQDEKCSFSAHDMYDSFQYFEYFRDSDSRGGIRNFSLNIGYHKKRLNKEKLYLMFNQPGVYYYDKVEILYVDLSNIDKNIEKFNNIHLNEFNKKNNYFNFKITSDKKGYACIAIPYSKGFKIYNNGNEVTVYNANLKYMGIEVSEGENNIELIYNRPFQNVGYILFLIGVMSLISVLAYQHIDLERDRY